MPAERLEDLAPTKQYTSADYISRKFSERVELLRGWIERMSALNRYHQDVSPIKSSKALTLKIA